MARLIDADEFERFLMNLPDEVLCEDCCYVVVNEMRKQPTIEAEPVKHGHWEEMRNAYGKLEGWIHAECGREVKCMESYCPNCGARMGGE